MKPGTVGAPPGDLRVEYFNCTFTPSVCLQRPDCSRIRRTVSHKVNAPRNTQSRIYHLLAAPRLQNTVQKPRQMAAWMRSGTRYLIVSPISCCWCNINQPSIVISLLSVPQNLIDGVALDGWRRLVGYFPIWDGMQRREIHTLCASET